jgi:glycosyl transferase family 25
VKAYVLNLPRSVERRDFITAQLARANLEYEIVDGIDGRDLDLDDPELVTPEARQEADFRPGVAGCALGHLKIYQKVLADGAEVALVLEDDAALPSDLQARIEAVTRHMHGPEVVLLNFYSPREPCLLSRHGSVDLGSSRLLAFPIDLRQPTSTAAYLITREACEKMAKAVVPVRAHADDWDYFYRAGAVDRVRCVVPPMVRPTPEFRSTIDYYSSRSWQTRLREAVGRHHIPVIYQAVVLRRRLVLRRWKRFELVAAPSPQTTEVRDSQTTEVRDRPGTGRIPN